MHWPDALVLWRNAGRFATGLTRVVPDCAGGALSTASHGVLAGVTFPVWVLGGSLATASQSRKPIVNYDPARSDPRSLSPYARFPQGLPDEVDRGLLTPRRQPQPQ